MAASENSVIIPEARSLDHDSVELITIDEIEEHSPIRRTVDAGSMSYTTVPVEVLEAAGIDIENSGELTEEQMSTIMTLIGPSATQLNLKQPQEQHQQEQHHRQDQPTGQPTYANEIPSVSSPPPEAGDRLTLYILDDGSLKLTDAALQKEFFFTPDELALQNIDVNNLTDESLQRIVQMAMDSTDVVDAKRRRIMEDDDGSAESSRTGFPASSSLELPTSISPTKTAITEERHAEPQLSLIGTEVEIKRDEKIYSATIRYCRQNGSYKVQFSDGHFEWVSEDEIRLFDAESLKKRGDHESYSEIADITTSGSATGSTSSKIANGRKVALQIPGIKVTPVNGYHKQEEPNFCCVICDQKVYQKEPQYIVIRIPACDKCTEQKMIVLESTIQDCATQTCFPEDGDNERHNGGKND